MRKVVMTLLLLGCMFLIGCTSSRVSMMPVTDKVSHPVKAIALAPDGGLLADLVRVLLSNRGFIVIDSASTSKLMVRLNLNEVEIARPEGLAKLKDQGIDAFLTVRSVAVYDQQPQSASAIVNSTHTGQVIAGISWQNDWGGQAGSIDKRTMRKGLVEAAAEISEALVATIRPN